MKLLIGVIILGLWFYSGNISNDNILPASHVKNVAVNQKPVESSAVSKPVLKDADSIHRVHGEVSRDIDRYIKVQATAYTWTGYRTASGTWPKEGRTVAINPAKFKLGQRIFIQGLGWRVCEDIIPPKSIRKGADLDIYMGDEGKARIWGRKNVKVYE